MAEENRVRALALKLASDIDKLENCSDEVSGRLSAGASMELDMLQDNVEDSEKALRACLRADVIEEVARRWQLNTWADVLKPLRLGVRSVAVAQAVTEWIRSQKS